MAVWRRKGPKEQRHGGTKSLRGISMVERRPKGTKSPKRGGVKVRKCIETEKQRCKGAETKGHGMQVRKAAHNCRHVEVRKNRFRLVFWLNAKTLKHKGAWI